MTAVRGSFPAPFLRRVSKYFPEKPPTETELREALEAQRRDYASRPSLERDILELSLEPGPPRTGEELAKRLQLKSRQRLLNAQDRLAYGVVQRIRAQRARAEERSVPIAPYFLTPDGEPTKLYRILVRHRRPDDTAEGMAYRARVAVRQSRVFLQEQMEAQDATVRERASAKLTLLGAWERLASPDKVKGADAGLETLVAGRFKNLPLSATEADTLAKAKRSGR